MTLPDDYGRPQVLAILAGLMVVTFVASLDQTVVDAAAHRIGESLIGAGDILALTSAKLGDIVPPRESARYDGYFVATYAAARVAGTLAGTVIAGRFTSRTGRYKILPVTGSFLLPAGMLLLWRLPAGTPLPYVEWAMFLLGTGAGLYAPTITLSMHNALPHADLQGET